MKTSWLIGMGVIFVVLTVIDGIAGGTYLGGGAGTMWAAMSGFQAIDVTSPVGVATGILMNLWAILAAIFDILTWNFPHIFAGVWQIVRWTLFAISLGIIVSLLMALRGVGSG